LAAPPGFAGVDVQDPQGHRAESLLPGTGEANGTSDHPGDATCIQHSRQQTTAAGCCTAVLLCCRYCCLLVLVLVLELELGLKEDS
jgi:hypothetical protein